MLEEKPVGTYQHKDLLWFYVEQSLCAREQGTFHSMLATYRLNSLLQINELQTEKGTFSKFKRKLLNVLR